MFDTQKVPTPTTIVCIAAIGIGSSFQFGFNVGIINVPQGVIQSWMNTTATFSGHSLDMAWSTVVAIWGIGGLLGCLSAGLMADRFGRKKCLMFNALPILVSAILFVAAKRSMWYPILIIARLINGFGCGSHTTIAPVYLMEIAPSHIRGLLGSFFQQFVTIGIAFSSVVGLQFVMGSETLWPFLLALTGIPALLQLVLLPFCPETPKYLLLFCDDEVATIKALKKLRRPNEIEFELQEIAEQKQAAEKQLRQVPWGSFWHQSILWKPLLICFVMMMANQLSGFTVALYYSTRVLKSAGLSAANSELVTVGFEWFFVLATLFCLPLVEKVGRRKLMLVGCMGMLTLNVLLTVFLSINATWVSYVAIILILLFMFFTAVGPGSIPWLYTSEVFLQNARSRANAIAAAVNWTLNFLVGLTFLPIQNEIHQYTFLIFAATMLFCFIVVYFFAPETKGRSVEDIVGTFGDVVY